MTICTGCNGEGGWWITHGAVRIWQMCSDCKGSGSVEED